MSAKAADTPTPTYPDRCMFCGAKWSGGSKGVLYYDCGGKAWVVRAKMLNDGQRADVRVHCPKGAGE